MHYEIERKARVSDVDGLRAELRRRFGAPAPTVKKEDRYFIEAGVDLAAPGAMTRRVVRVRRLDDGTARATAKRRTLVGATEVNREVEFGVDDADAFEEFVVGYLGLEPLVTKRKVTEAHGAPPLVAELSEVGGLGWFLEVEVIAASAAEEATAIARIDEVFAACAPWIGAPEPRQYIVLLLEAAGRIPAGGTGFGEVRGAGQ